MKKLIAIAIAAVAVLAIPAVASAHRRATNAEKEALVYQASGRYFGNLNVDEPRSAPARCFRADIATVVKGSQWGAWTFAVYAYQHEQACRAGNGIAVEHKIGRRWFVYWEGSAGYPPTHTKSYPNGFKLQGVPRNIFNDLEKGLGG